MVPAFAPPMPIIATPREISDPDERFQNGTFLEKAWFVTCVLLFVVTLVTLALGNAVAQPIVRAIKR